MLYFYFLGWYVDEFHIHDGVLYKNNFLSFLSVIFRSCGIVIGILKLEINLTFTWEVNAFFWMRTDKIRISIFLVEGLFILSVSCNWNYFNKTFPWGQDSALFYEY
jgi:hypothetical protein